uniref:Uncharacterized protein n=1 Tax=Tanacetum cinerariifolium TaxID=118510 RepID=A0A6L2LCR0_TANCI|nr:hypothetical protein [Tanacetum cinerariifolium]
MENKPISSVKLAQEYKEFLENSSKEIAVSSSNLEKEEPQQDSDIRHLIREECCVEDLIKSALNSKLLSINLNSQRLDKKEQEVQNVLEQPAEHGSRVEKSLQNFKVIHKNFISLNNTSQISPIHAVAPILSTKETEHSLSMRYEHLSITPQMESNEVRESNAKNLLPTPSECEVASEDEFECDVPAKDDSSPAFTTFSNPLFNNDDLDSSDDESLPEEDVPAEELKVYSNPLFDKEEIHSDKLDPHCFNVESDFVESFLNHDTFIDSSSKFDFFEHNVEEERIKREHADYISRMEMLVTINPRPHPTISIITSTDDVLPLSVENDDSDGEVDAVDDLHVDNSILNSEHESFESKESDFDNPSVLLPPPEPPDEELDFEIDFGDEISVVRNTIVEFECVDARVKFDVSNDKNDDYSYFMFVKVFSLLSAESEDTFFDPGISV